MMDVQQFELDKSRFGEVQKVIIARALPLMLLSLSVGVGMSHFNNTAQQESPSFLLIMIPTSLILLALGIYKGVQRQKRLFMSYLLIIDEHRIVREQATVPTIKLAANEIREIYKAPDGSYAVKGDSINQTILIPAQIENASALEEGLARFSPLVIPPPTPVAVKAMRLLPIAVLVLMVIVYTSLNKTAVAISGTLLVGALGYSLVSTQLSKHVDGKTKKTMWIVLLVIVSVLAIMYAKLSA